MNIKKAASWLLLSAMLVLAAGCDRDLPAGDKESAVTSEAATNTEQESAAEQADETTKTPAEAETDNSLSTTEDGETVSKPPETTSPPIDEPIKEGSVFNLSKTGQNVVIILLDRAMNEYIPYIFKEKPELARQFDGFTYYSNTISFGGYTNFGIPPVYGGYEYTPVEMNKRDTELLVDKHNEALKVLPVLFADRGYDVTVCDPVYAGYEWVGDLSIYEPYADIKAYNLKGTITSEACEQAGYPSAFSESYAIMEHLSDLTNITSDPQNTFLFLSNDMTHEPVYLQAPDYVPASSVDNSAYDASLPADRFVWNGVRLRVDTSWKMRHYQVNISAMLRLGEWFDYLREEGVYDNTRIILVADHGRHLGQIDELVMGGSDTLMDVELYYPLLMVKDFGSHGFVTDDQFMTTADVPTLATGNLIQNPTNPFTGNPINNQEKYAHDQIVIVSHEWQVTTNNGYTFNPAWWASVKDDLWERDNWVFTQNKGILKEHRLDESLGVVE